MAEAEVFQAPGLSDMDDFGIRGSDGSEADPMADLEVMRAADGTPLTAAGRPSGVPGSTGSGSDTGADGLALGRESVGAGVRKSLAAGGLDDGGFGDDFGGGFGDDMGGLGDGFGDDLGGGLGIEIEGVDEAMDAVGRGDAASVAGLSTDGMEIEGGAGSAPGDGPALATMAELQQAAGGDAAQAPVPSSSADQGAAASGSGARARAPAARRQRKRKRAAQDDSTVMPSLVLKMQIRDDAPLLMPQLMGYKRMRLWRMATGAEPRPASVLLRPSLRPNASRHARELLLDALDARLARPAALRRAAPELADALASQQMGGAGAFVRVDDDMLGELRRTDRKLQQRVRAVMAEFVGEDETSAASSGGHGDDGTEVEGLRTPSRSVIGGAPEDDFGG